MNMRSSTLHLPLSTFHKCAYVDGILWISVDKSYNKVHAQFMVDNDTRSTILIHTLYTRIGMSLMLFWQYLKKKVDQKSTYAQCLLIRLI